MPTKEDNLREGGCFNNNHGNVTASIFGSAPFFDKRDVVQVKYEMIRAASNGEGSVTKIAGEHGFSRKSYYQASKAFDTGGIVALVPQKKGPRGPSKMNPDVSAFIDSYSSGHANAKAKELSAALEAEKGIRVHPRTIHRHIKKN